MGALSFQFSLKKLKLKTTFFRKICMNFPVTTVKLKLYFFDITYIRMSKLSTRKPSKERKLSS